MRIELIIGAAGIGASCGGGSQWLLQKLRRGGDFSVLTLTAAAAALCALSALVNPLGAALLVAVWVAVLTVPLAAVDLVHHRLPDAITLPAIPISAVVLLITSRIWPGSGNVLRAVLAAGLVWGGFLLLYYLSRRAMGLGDVKLSVTVGLLLGYWSWPLALVGVGLAFILGALVSATGIALRRLRMASAIPFGPFLLAATWLSVAIPGLRSGTWI